MSWSRTVNRIRPPSKTSSVRPGVRWWLDRSVRVKGLTVVAVPMFALIAVAGASLALQRQEAGERQVSLRANALARATLVVLADTVEAETGVRGYAGTADPAFLPPYEAAAVRLATDVRKLGVAAVTVRERAQADAVAATVADELAQLDDLREAVLAGSAGAALSPALKAGKTTMDKLRAQVATLVAEPSRLIVQKRATVAHLEEIIEIVEVVGLGPGPAGRSGRGRAVHVRHLAAGAGGRRQRQPAGTGRLVVADRGLDRRVGAVGRFADPGTAVDGDPVA